MEAALESFRFLIPIDQSYLTYLRAVGVAGQSSTVIGQHQGKIAQILVAIVNKPSRAAPEFWDLLVTIPLVTRLDFTPPSIIHQVLDQSGGGQKLGDEVNTYLRDGRLWSAYHLVKQAQVVSESLQNDIVVAILRRHLRLWKSYSVWRPEEARIQRWEQRSLTAAQERKLLPVIQLEGPDTVTSQQPCLKLVVSSCYETVNVSPKTQDNVERYLDILDQCFIQGARSVDLFIYVCVDSPTTTEKSLSIMKKALERGDDQYCQTMLIIMRAMLESKTSLIRRMSDLCTLLSTPGVEQVLIDMRVKIEKVAELLRSTLKTAQENFCKQLERVVPEQLGEMLHSLYSALARASWIHSVFPPEVLRYAQQVPSLDKLTVLFQQLEEGINASSEDTTSRIKTYLASVLGGCIEKGDTTSLAPIRNELKFWDDSPNSLRRDLAGILRKMPNVDDGIYTSCLEAMTGEDDLLLNDIKHQLAVEGSAGFVGYLRYLTHRRKLEQLTDDCWLSLAEVLFTKQGPAFLPEMSDFLSFEDWIELLDDVLKTFGQFIDRPRYQKLDHLDALMPWWKYLADHRDAVDAIRNLPLQAPGVRWLYFPHSYKEVMELLQDVQRIDLKGSIEQRVLSRLSPKATNAPLVCDCLRAISQAFPSGRAVLERVLARLQNEDISAKGMGLIMKTWERSSIIRKEDKYALRLVRDLFDIPSGASTTSSSSAKNLLEAEYSKLMARAEELEASRMELRQKDPGKAKVLVKKLKLSDVGRNVDRAIPDDLIDAIETVGEDEYVLAFSLMGLSELHRLGRGVPRDARLLVVRVKLRPIAQFCVHTFPQDETIHHHRPWRANTGAAPDAAVCSTRPNLFVYYVCHHLHRLLQGGRPSLCKIHDLVSDLIAKAPATCVVCCAPMTNKLWKPSTCRAGCSISLRKSSLEVRMHNFIVDPLVIDLLLTSLSAAATGSHHDQLLTGCPIPHTRIQAEINAIPPLSQLQTANDLRAALRGSDAFSNEKEKLLSWMCLHFWGFLLTAPDNLKIPSKPGALQFVVPNAHHEHETLFNAQYGSHGPSSSSSGIVFNGTRITRLWGILAEGLKVLSGADLQVTGAAHGSGVYVAEEPSLSLQYASVFGAHQGWAHSALKNYSVLLGCQLAGHIPNNSYHVVQKAERLAVRYVFLLPPNFQCPIRAHVVGAMTQANAALSTKMLP